MQVYLKVRIDASSTWSSKTKNRVRRQLMEAVMEAETC